MLFEALVPALVHRRVTRQPALLTGPVAERFPATLLLADLSGFSPLAERFSRRGARGAEDLKDLLNLLFGRLVDLVDDHGGEVLKFAGDATLALWPANGEGDAAATRRAAQCALDAQELVGGIEAADGLRLRLRVGVGAGEVWTASVGGVAERWELVLAGRPLEQAVAAMARSQPGEVLISPPAWEQLAPSATARHLGGGTVCLDAILNPLRPEPPARITLDPGALPLLRAYVPRAVQARLDAEQTEWLAEFRRASVLFVNVEGIDYAASDALDRLQGAVVAVQTAVYRYGGSLNQLLVDDKGTVVVCGWGLALHTHGDDAVRATRAALEIRRELVATGLRTSCGIATGEVFTGLRGSLRRAEYAMIGNVVNLSARLMQAAAGDILCDPATFEAARRQVEIHPLAALQVKGREEPLDVYRPAAQRRTSTAELSSDIVGRAAERRTLSERLATLATGRGGGLVLLVGEAGMGKSRLVADLAERARELGLHTLIAAGNAVERSAPYHPWRDLFEPLLGLAGLAGAERERRVRELLEPSPRLSPFAPLLDPVLQLGLAETDRTRNVTPLGRAQLTRDLLVQLLLGASGGTPLVVVLEDAHWFDSASWALAEGLYRRFPQLFLLVVLRPLGEAEQPAELRRLGEAPEAIRLCLETLSSEEARALAAQRLRARTLDEPVARLLFEKAEGHPFFTEELISALRDRELIRVTDGICRFTAAASAPGSHGLPDTVQAVITSRIDHLTPAQQLTLKVASVLGRTFDLETLRAIHPIAADREELPRHLDALAARDLVQLVSQELAPSYEFKHSITHEASYSLLPFAQRRQLHEAAAEWYEGRHAADLSAVFALLAHHWSRAEAGEKAVFYLDKAGEQAFDRYANEEAVRFFSEALAAEGRLGVPETAGRPVPLPWRRQVSTREARYIRWERYLGEAYVKLGRWQESWSHCEQILAYLGLRLPASPAGWRRGLAAEALVQLCHRLSPWPPRRLEPPAARLLREGVVAYNHIGAIAYMANRPAPILFALAKALNLAERLGPIPELAAAYADLGNVVSLVPLHALARSYGRRARQIALKLGDPATTAKVLSRTGIYRTSVGDWSACADLETSMELADQIGDSVQSNESAVVRTRAALMRGELELAARLSEEVQTRAQANATAAQQVWAIAGRASALFYMGQKEEALELANLGLLLLAGGEREDQLSRMDLLGTTTGVYLARGELNLARQAADRMLEELARSPRTGHFAFLGMSKAAQTYLALWEREPADAGLSAAKARRACSTIARFCRVSPPAQASALLWQGCVEWLDGRRDAAHACWRRCLTVAARFALPYETARAHYEIGRRLSLADPARRDHLRQAEEGFRRIKAKTDLEQVLAVLQAG